ncbi:MAG: TonB-dependent receptor [Pseudomonadota bacterium]
MSINKVSLVALACVIALEVAEGQESSVGEESDDIRYLHDASTCGPALCEIPASSRFSPVIVTGRAQYIRDTAASISFLGGGQIEQLNALRLGDVLADVPGVFFSGLNGPRETPQIRNTLSFDNRTLFVEDGVPLQSSVFFDQSALGYSTALASPGSVEVLRGPGTALYGSDAFTGVVAARSQETDRRFTGNLRARYGEFDLFDIAGSLNIPFGDNEVMLGERHALRITGAVAGERGFRDETRFQRAHALARHTFEQGNWSTDSILTYTDSFTESATSIPFSDFEAGEIFGSGLNPQVDPEEAEEDVEYLRLQTKIAYETETAFGDTRFEVTPYLRSQEVASTLTFQPATTPRETADVDTFGLLPRAYFDHNDGSTTIVGVDLEFTDFDLLLEQTRPDAIVFGSVFLQGVQFDYNVGFNAYSPYIQHERSFFDDSVTLTLGLRYDRLRYDFDNNLEDIPGDARLQVEDRVDTFDSFSPKVRLLWDVTDNQQLFARYARGFRTPRASELYELEDGQAEFVLDPEIADSGELGWRANWLDNRLSTELIGYWQVTRDGVVTDVQTAAGNISINAGERRFAGVEIAASADLPFGFDAQLAFAFQDFEFRQFAAEPGSPFDGNTIEEAPRRLGNLTLNWVPPFFEGVTATARVRYLGEWELNSANTLETDDEFILTLLGEWRVTDNVAVELRLENITDNNFAIFADAPFFAPAGRARPGQPRTVSGGIKLNF